MSRPAFKSREGRNMERSTAKPTSPRWCNSPKPSRNRTQEVVQKR